MFQKSRLIALTLITLLAATSAFANPYGITESYFTDATHQTPVGSWFTPGWNCPDDEGYSWGTTSDYREVVRYASCNQVLVNAHTCWEWEDDEWVMVDCPCPFC